MSSADKKSLTDFLTPGFAQIELLRHQNVGAFSFNYLGKLG